MDTVNSLSFDNPLPNVPWVESPFFEKIFTLENFPIETINIAKSLYENGYAVLDFPETELDQIIGDVFMDLDGRYNWDSQKNNINPRIQDAWEVSSAVKKIATNQAIMQLLESLYGRKPVPFQTLNFPVGTEQTVHTDCVHFHSIPERYMCGVWLALEDIDENNGPLFYIPKSHKLPIYINEHTRQIPDFSNPYKNYSDYDILWNQLIEAHHLQKEYFFPKKGQAIIWSANLLHGGAPHHDKTRTRHSQVTHYFFEDCVYYTPLSSLESLGIMDQREIKDIGTGKIIPNSTNGMVLDQEYVNCVSWRGERSQKILERGIIPADFDGQIYLKLNPDVAAAGVDARVHYRSHGLTEGRRYRE